MAGEQGSNLISIVGLSLESVNILDGDLSLKSVNILGGDLISIQIVDRFEAKTHNDYALHAVHTFVKYLVRKIHHHGVACCMLLTLQILSCIFLIFSLELLISSDKIE